MSGLETTRPDPLAPTLCIAIQINQELSTAQKEALKSLVQAFRDPSATTSKDYRTPIAKHRIVKDEPVRPVRQRPYSVAPKERDVIKREVMHMLDDGVIQPPKSAWAPPVVLVKKKNNTLHFRVE